MALGYDFLKFNTTVLPWGTAYGEDFEHVETTGLSEAGYELDIVTRLNKPTYTYTFRVTDFWKTKLLAICNEISGTLYINNDAGHTVRPRLQSAPLVTNSELTPGTEGLYDVTIAFIER